MLTAIFYFFTFYIICFIALIFGGALKTINSIKATIEFWKMKL